MVKTTLCSCGSSSKILAEESSNPGFFAVRCRKCRAWLHWIGEYDLEILIGKDGEKL